MILRLKQWVSEKIRYWVQKRHPLSNPQHLYSNRIYILPSAFGWLYGIVILTITTGAINYQLNTAYFFVFLLAILGLLSMWQTHQNLKNLSIQCMMIDDVEEGHPAKIRLFINPKHQLRYGLIFSTNQGEVVTVEKIPKEGSKAILPLETHARGQFKIPPIKIYSYYPLGIFKVWSYLYYDVNYYVYPAAKHPGFWPVSISEESLLDNPIQHPGDEELYELQSVESPWVQASRIAWKISARTNEWYLKKMTNPAGEYWLFRLEDLQETDLETSLEYLSYWIQTAEQLKQPYALELNGKASLFGFGEEHKRSCLRKLAVY
ncbi:hypothetical protein [Legionella impletisoli]|uniref:Membrane protein n=1 Tax=Legionella impletisoli TaxID=343510 RepID=A0A917JSF6_9GAMM|nr:hypothetical protein [Legionella impletisoli]GGI81624.1 membrane protein [Legionella impletisoli]